MEIFLWVSNKSLNLNRTISSKRHHLISAGPRISHQGPSKPAPPGPGTWLLKQTRRWARRKADCSSRGWMWPSTGSKSHEDDLNRRLWPAGTSGLCGGLCVDCLCVLWQDAGVTAVNVPARELAVQNNPQRSLQLEELVQKALLKYNWPSRRARGRTGPHVSSLYVLIDA